MPPLPAEPTSAPPGSAERIDVMSWRMRHGYQLHHPGDAKGCRCKTRAKHARPETPGVEKRFRKWRARIWIPGEGQRPGRRRGQVWRGHYRHLGCFPTEAEARAAVKAAKRKRK